MAMEVEDLGAVIYEKEGPIARVIMNRPEKANIQSSALVWGFDDALKKADRDYDVKVVIIKGNGRGFCAGHDLAGGAEENPEPAENTKLWGHQWKARFDRFVWPVLYLWEFPKPTIAQVHGYALGGGSYFAYLPDITIASEDAYFQMPLVQGLGFPGGQTMVEPWLFMNFKRAAEYLYTAKTLSASEALQMGLINKVVSRDDLESEVEAMAAHIAQAPLPTLMTAKAGLKRAWELMGMRVHLQMSTDLMTVASTSTPVKEFLAERTGMYARQAAEKRAQKAAATTNA